MTAQLVIPGSAFPALPEPLGRAYERAIGYIRNPHAANTIRAYKAAWERWAVHCPRVPCDPLPVEPLHLVGYLQELTDEQHKAPNTVRLELAALCALDAAHALATGDLERPSLRANHLVQRWLKGWGKDNPRAPRRRAPALTVAELGRVLREAQEPAKNASRIAHAALYARDRAIITIGVAGGFRVNELCALELGDVELVAGGVRVRLRRAKNDQQGEGHERVLLPQAAKLHCPAAAFEAWARIRGAVPGPLFCPIRRTGLLELGARLDEAAAMRVIVNRCKAAELERVTSHSLRATFYTLTKRKPLSDVMKHVNSRSVQTALNYQRSASLFDPDTNPTSGLLDG